MDADDLTCPASLTITGLIMVLPVHITKPSYPPSLVDRPRLYDRLDGWQAARVVVVQAPAGYGKSSLVSRWLDVSGLAARSAWLSLDETHCDPQELLRGLASALNAALPGLLAIMQPGLDTLQSDPQRMMRKLVAALWEGLAPANGAPEVQALLVLDDLHLIADSEAGALLTPLLEKGPPGLHFVLLTRQAIPLPLTRLYASGQVVELTTADLRFTADEVQQYLLARRILSSPEELAQIVERTEGWVVALQLALHSQRTPGSLAAYLANLRGDSRWLARYLTEEVLAQQSPALRAFLLRTSILESFDASLAGAVAGVDDAYGLLAELQRHELFLIPLDAAGAWFRYHHLFQELLQHRLAEVEGKAATNERRRRAAGWLAGQGQLLPAVRHLLAAGDDDEAAALVERRIRPAILHHPVRAQQLFDALPPEVAQRRPRLLLERCLISIIDANKDLTRHVDNAQRCLDGHPPSPPLAEVYEAELLFYRAAARYAEGDFEAAALLAQETQSRSGDLDRLLAGALDFLRMRLSALAADKTAQLSLASRALAAFDAEGFVLGQIAVRRELAMLDVQAGRSAKASREFDRIALAFGADPLAPRPEMEWVYAYAAEHSYWQNQLDEAMRTIEAGLHIAATFQNDEMAQALIYLRSLCALRRRETKAVEELPPPAGMVSGWYRFADWQIRWLLAVDRVDEAWEVARQYQAGLANDLASMAYFHAIPYLRGYVARGANLEAIRPLLSDAVDASVAANDLPRQLELLALRAWLELQTGEGEAVRQTLSQVEALAARTGYVRVLLDIPALDVRMPPARRADARRVAAPPAQGDQPLSEREQTILALLADDLTYEQIAGTLVISVNTVRTHVRHTYKKLGAHRRDQAIQRARELGLVR